MKPAVINVDLAWGAACDLVLLVQDAAGVPLDLSGAALDFALKAGDASVPLAVDAADAAEGLVRVRVPGQDLGMFPWEGWLQTSPETPRERILRGLMTVTDKVDPRAEGNPSTHRYFVRLSDAVTVSVDSVDLAWWAYAHALKAQESMESLADAWPETVSEAKQDVHAVKEDALAAIRDKQADAVLAVGRAQKTATDKIAGAQADAVSAVQEAEEEAQGTITPLVQRAETAKEAIDQAEGRINTAATNAATSATSAANSATEAQQALAAIPQVDASGNMTIPGGLTAAGTVNANGGVNIPLAVGAPTDTSAVNCLYAMGLAGAVQALVQPIYLNSSSITVAGSISKSSNGTLAGLTQRFSVGAASAGSNAYGSAVIPLIGPNGQFNYSSVCGFSLAVNATAFAKFTFGIGRGSKTNRTGLTMDSYSMIPGNELAVNHGEIIDVTINTPYDTVRKGYEIRVREIFYVSSVGHWQVKTTTVFLPVGHNELMPNGLNRLIYMQSGPPSTAVREENAALYMELGGGSTNTLFKIASLRGFIAFEAGTGVSTLIIDARNEKTYALSADAGTGTRHLYANGLTNPTYHALEAMAINAIESEETADFVDINTPIEES